MTHGDTEHCAFSKNAIYEQLVRAACPIFETRQFTRILIVYSDDVHVPDIQDTAKIRLEGETAQRSRPDELPGIKDAWP